MRTWHRRGVTADRRPTLEEAKAKLTNKRAINYAGAYTPKAPEKTGEMLGALLGAIDEEQFRSFAVLYIMDMSYPRPDIAWACGVVERETRWTA